MNVLGKQPEGVSPLEQIDEQRARVVSAADRGKRVDIPKVANQKRGFRRAKIVFIGVAHNSPVAAKMTAYRIAGGDEPGVVARNQPEFGQKQNAGIKLNPIQNANKRVLIFVPCAR